jgi:hypothetical protein
MIPEEKDDLDRRAFRRTLVRVLVVQLVALALLWLLQSSYGAG